MSIPGVKLRLERYLTSRDEQLTDLAAKYLRGLEVRLNQAADAGDLKLATAFGEEKQRVETLQKTLATPPGSDPLAAVATPPRLPDLAESEPEPLRILRQTWTSELEKIQSALDTALGQSLQALESELTRARDFDRAKVVLAYRESLRSSAGVPPAAESTGRMPAGPTGGTPVLQPDLARATKDAPFENSLGMKFVPVPGTDVLFCIHETRYRDYAVYAAEAANVATNWKNQTHDGFALTENKEDHPVVYVSWEDAQSFCAWLSKKEGKTYRLPTDEEWSIAVGLGRKEKHGKNITPAMLNSKESTEFPWDGDFPPKTKDQAGNYSDASRKAKAPRGDAQYLEDYDDGFPTTAPVMSFKPNKFGLYDLGGNVWEWCDDWYDNAKIERVLRGCSWFSIERGNLLSSNRARSTPTNRSSHYGFRCVMVVSSSAP